MNDLRLEGCRCDTLLGYMKGLGTLRLVATQADRGARASWGGATFVLHTQLEREQLEAFFLQSYCPTPIVNPWNNSAGFDRKMAAGKVDRASAILQQIRSTMSERWASYRRVLDFIFSEYVDSGMREQLLAAGQKDDLIRALRAKIPAEGLPWIDAAVAITQDNVVYPYLLGSGGNDGRLDFAVNFAERALDVIGEAALLDTPGLLRDSLEDSTAAALTPGAAIGQFSARHAGGVNASSGFGADSLVNPWDYVLMMEGSICFRSAASRRLGYRTASDGQRPRSVFPFAFRGVPGGYGSASAAELSRGELWLPVWDGRISYAGLADLFHRGRLDLPSDGSTSIVRSAAVATEAAAAAVTMGASLGLREFKRVAFLQRNGLAYTAAASGEVRVAGRREPIVAQISRRIADWVERIPEAAKTGAIAERLREFDDTLFAIARGRNRDARRDQDLLLALARLEFAVARRAPERPSPLSFLEPRVIEEISDSSAEHRLAAALCSLGEGHPAMGIRMDMEHVAYDEAKRRLVYDPSSQPLLSANIENTLSEMCVRRTRLMRESGEDSWLFGTRCVGVADVAEMLSSGSGSQLRKRLTPLLMAYSIVCPPRRPRRMRGTGGNMPLPAAYAVMKVVIDHPTACDPRITAHLHARDARRAVELAVRRAMTIDGLSIRFRDVTGARIDDPRWYASALLVPIDRSKCSYRQLLTAALVEPPKPEDIEHYLKITFPDATI